MESAAELEDLKEAALELYDLSKKYFELNKTSPDLLVVVKKEPKSWSKPEGVYAIAILRGDEKDLIPNILSQFPHTKAYALIMHADAWVAPKGEHHKNLTVDQLKARSKKSDCFCLNIIQFTKSEIIKMEAYTIVDEKVIWEDQLHEYQDKGLTSDVNPLFTNALISEKDFE